MARIIVFIIFGGLGLVMLYVGLTQFFLQRRMLANASPVQAVITRSEVFSSTSHDTDRRVERSTSTTTHRPEVRFHYELDGTPYDSDLLYPNIIVRSYASRDAAAEALTAYPVGATVQAYVDRDHPDKAFLIREKSMGPVVFIIIGLLLPPVAWFAGYLI